MTGMDAELEFWKREIEKYPGEDYAAIRASGIKGLLAMWPEIVALEGQGLDLGCSPVSVFEDCHDGLRMYAIDPLLEEYQKLYVPETPTVRYIGGHEDDGRILFSNGFFDFIFCVNVIDHTHYYGNLLGEMKRVLKPGGLLFFMVNFDEVLNPPNHVKLWTHDVVRWNLQRSSVHPFFLLRETVVWNQLFQKYMYWGKWRNGGVGDGG